MSALAGVLVTAAVTPALAVTGLAANNSITMFENLPGFLKIDDLAQKSTIYAMRADGTASPMASFFDDNREEVSIDYISPYLKDAAVSGEDPRYYEHGGIDIKGTLSAVVNEFIPGGATRGGSSITQQYVKNVLINNGMNEATTEEEKQAAYEAATATTPERKLKEMRYAISVDKKYTKDEILQGYLNIAAFGGRVYGVQSAAQYYFGTNAKDLTLPQAASLIAIVNWPEKFRLDNPESETNGANTVVDGETVPYADNKDRRDYILNEMLQEKKITQEEHDAAVATPVQPDIHEPSTGCQVSQTYSYFCDYVTWEIKNKLDDPETPDVNEGAEMLARGGLDIYTTIDVDLQAEATAALKDNVPASISEMDLGGSVVSVEVGTGRILAMAQNTVYNLDPEVTGDQYSAVNYNAGIDYGGSSGFQPGSTFKTFTLAEWLIEGHSLNESMDARKRNNWGDFKDSCEGTVNVDGWDPGNDEGGNGGFWTALFNTVNSENTGFIAMAKQLDLCGIKKTATALMSDGRADGKPLGEGVNADGDRIPFGPSAVLGTEEVAPLSMATAFAAYAGGGKSCTPVAIDKITDAKGEAVEVPKSTCTQAITADVAAGMDYALNKVMTGGTGSSSLYKMDTSGTPMIGKTGTTDNNEATWMSGASSKVATVVGVYNATGHVNLRDTYINGEQAAVLRHNIWPRVMDVANNKYGGDAFPDPKSEFLFAPQASVPSVLGLSPDAAKMALETAGFGYALDGEVDSDQPKGTIGSQSASGTATRGSLITVKVSRGNMSALPDVTGSQADQAEATLRAAGFDVARDEQSVTDESQNGIVQSQSPGAGEGAKAGSKITIVVGRFDGDDGQGNGDGNGNDGGNQPDGGNDGG
ncbi:membrane peptidoglycan carboxypeptidase [Agromyces terreus]|uniref:Membrane peptidoglycan carboxypeptidase n=1 Tax=Agromyces terreus TaxID=424795 RepID=A0A9X2GXV4_9MICO|nr:transglycosylase domain-containing protein [Agromyces terreus]MCP2369436.1 membrane peptidoglycan carboxypeptidase [Agromyces terreus]